MPRRVRQLPEGQGITLIALTGWGQEEDRRRSSDAGFDYHLVKPVDHAANKGAESRRDAVQPSDRLSRRLRGADRLPGCLQWPARVDRRCCRRLLTVQDRTGSSVLPLTHESLALSPGVRRASVTDGLQQLQSRKVIQCNRGQIVILNRPKLRSLACECYQAINDEYARLFESAGGYGTSPSAARARPISYFALRGRFDCTVEHIDIAWSARSPLLGT